MTEGVFDFGRQFPEGLSIALGDEERVVAEAAGAARGACDASRACALESVERAGRGVGDGDDADEARMPLGVSGRVKLAEQLRHALGIGCLAPRVAGGTDAGRAAE